MTTVFTLTSGEMTTTTNLDEWVITSATAIAAGAEDVELHRGDRININGDVRRDGAFIANIA